MPLRMSIPANRIRFTTGTGAIHQPRIVTFALVPVVVFGFLDAMYLAHERSYRELYARIGNSVDALRTQDERSELFVLLRGPRRSWRPFHFPFAFLTFNLNHFSGSPIM